MQSEFNYIIEAKYKTRVIFHMIPKSEYLQKVTEQASYAADHATDPLDKTPASINDKYPRENDIQFDIFVSLDKTMIDNMIKSGYIANLTTDMTVTYNQKLFSLNDKTSVSDIIYQNAVWKDAEGASVYYGVPSNFLIGEYTYYLIEKEKADAHYFSKDESVSIEARVNELLQAIEKNDSIVDKATYKAEVVQTITGDYSKRATVDTEKYYVYVKQMPVVNVDRLYEGMFCISNMCRYKDRAMKVIAELYTNVDLHTTLQYGAENLNYRFAQVNGEKVVELIAGAPAYAIDPKYTGNITKLYPCLEKGYDKTYVENLYIQNTEAILP
jgi:hypothetical protein